MLLLFMLSMMLLLLFFTGLDNLLSTFAYFQNLKKTNKSIILSLKSRKKRQYALLATIIMILSTSLGGFILYENIQVEKIKINNLPKEPKQTIISQFDTSGDLYSGIGCYDKFEKYAEIDTRPPNVR